MLVRLYKPMVRPILEYANTIWGPYDAMEHQCRATKIDHQFV